MLSQFPHQKYRLENQVMFFPGPEDDYVSPYFL